MMIKHQIKILQSIATTILAGGQGFGGTATPRQPTQAIKLYDIEASQYCRRVREVLTLLNLDVEVYPCPKNGTRFRPEAEKIIKAFGKKIQFPLLIDQNTGATLQDSQEIIDYLFKTYGKTGKTPKKWQNFQQRHILERLTSRVSLMRGLKADPMNTYTALPAKRLQLWSFEASPYTRLVRERLCELELPYILYNVPKERWQDMGLAALRVKPGKYVPLPNGKRSKEIMNMQGRLQVPYLVDNNTGVRMFESEKILQYLNQHYAGE